MRRPTARHIAALLIPACLTAAGWMGGSCRRSTSSDSQTDDSLHRPLPDTLRVGTLYSPTSYFIYRQEPMGYDYDLVSRFAADKGLHLSLEIAPSLARAVEMLDSGLIDLLAYEVPVTGEYRQRVIPCGIENVTYQVLVQPKKGNAPLITDVTQLVGREVYVEESSKYLQRLNNLNEELGGGIIIHQVDRDTLITEDLMEMVSGGEIPLTVVDSDIGRLNKTYYNDLDISLQISFPQRSAWGVAPDHRWLADSIDAWSSGERPRRQQATLLKRYFELSKGAIPGSAAVKIDLSKGIVSPFDHLFRRYASTIGWDWRLIASQGYKESRFDSTVVSWAGARGIMQLMPRTARAHGITDDMMTNNEASISTAVKIIAALDKSLASRVPDRTERRKFVVAAYNSGLAHVLDAIALADKYGMNPQVWEGNVEQALLLKSKPEYYNDPVCKYGYFHGRQTYNYVHEVFALYDQICQKIQQ